MRGTTLALVAAVVFSAGCFAAPPTLSWPDEVHGPVYAFGKLKADGEFKYLAWKTPRGLKVERLGERELLFTGPPGSYLFEAVASNDEGITGFERSSVVIGDGQPTPDIKPDPKPDIKPAPPAPPKDIPFPGVSGLHVLIVLETADRSKYDPGQLNVMDGRQVREWLDANCAALTSTRKAWNIWDKDVDARSFGQAWDDALKRKRDSLPWLIASNGTKAIEIPLPKTPQEFIEKVGAVK